MKQAPSASGVGKRNPINRAEARSYQNGYRTMRFKPQTNHIRWADSVWRWDGTHGRVIAPRWRGSWHCVKWDDEPDPVTVDERQIDAWAPGSGETFFVITLAELYCRESVERQYTGL